MNSHLSYAGIRKLNVSIRLRRWANATFAFAALTLLCVGSGRAQTYNVISLGTLGGTLSDTGGINDRGQVAGGSTLSGDVVIHAFVWNKGSMADLGTLGGPNSFANAVSNTIGAVGLSDVSTSPGNPNLCFEEIGTSNQCHAFLWQNGVMIDLGTLGGESSAISGDGINSSGQAVGAAEIAGSDPLNPGYQAFHAFLWQNGAMTDLGTLGGPDSQAFGINDAEQIVGQAATTSTPLACGCVPVHAFLWQHGEMSDIGTLGGNFSIALGVNGQAQITGGASKTGDQAFHAFFWRAGKMIDIGTLPGDGVSIGTDISSKGQVVGQSCGNQGCRAFIWQNGIMTDLNTLIPPDSSLYLVSAFQINAFGQINGTAIDTSNNNEVRAYLATPVNGGTAHLRPALTLRQSVRSLIQRSLRYRYHIAIPIG